MTQHPRRQPTSSRLTRWPPTACAVVVAAAFLSAQNVPPAASRDASALIQQVRAALCLDRAGPIDSLLLTGECELLTSPQLSGGFELRLVLPNRFLTVNRFNGVEDAVGRRLDGNRFIDLGAARLSLASKEVTDAVNAYHLAHLRRESTLLAFALLLTDRTAVPVTFAYAGRARAPDGEAETLELVWGEKLSVRLFVDAATKLPLLMTFEEMEIARRAPPPSSFKDFKPSMPTWEKVEQKMYLGDYRRVKGVLFPHSITLENAGPRSIRRRVTSVKFNAREIVEAFR